MWAEPAVQELSGGRLHLQHGPIDLVLKAWGRPADVAAAYRAAVARFGTILIELTAELCELRRPIAANPRIASPVGHRMAAACQPFRDHFITPMAAVAGSVADEICHIMRAAAPLDRLYVNNGGDIAVHVAPGHELVLGVAGDFSAGDLTRATIPVINGHICIAAGMGIRGIATSGWRGRSFSLGIADSVTVLAASAATADAAATLIANAVDIDSTAVQRTPATALDPDSDLGDRRVTVAVGALSELEIETALNAGQRLAETCRRRGLIIGAALQLRMRTRTVGVPATAIAGAFASQLEETSP